LICNMFNWTYEDLSGKIIVQHSLDTIILRQYLGV
jgi:hypothetical protein